MTDWPTLLHRRRHGEPVARLAREYGVQPNTIYKQIAKADEPRAVRGVKARERTCFRCHRPLDGPHTCFGEPEHISSILPRVLDAIRRAD